MEHTGARRRGTQVLNALDGVNWTVASGGYLLLRIPGGADPPKSVKFMTSKPARPTKWER